MRFLSFTCLSQQVEVSNSHCRHCLNHGHRPGQHTRVMPTTSREEGGVTFQVNRLLFFEDGSHGLKGHTEINVLSV